MDLMKHKLPQAEPDAPWLRETRSRVLARVAGRRRARRGVRAGWLAGAAASVAVLALLVLMPRTSASFAQVQRSIDRAHTLQFASTLVLEQDGSPFPLSTARSWADRELGARLDVDLLGAPLAQFWLPLRGEPVLVDHTHRAIVPIELPRALDARELLRFDPATLVRQLGRASGEVRPLPIDDAMSQGNLAAFRVPATAMGLSADSTLDVTVDLATHLPVRIAARVPLGHGEAVLLTLDQFRWSEPIAAETLMLDVPTDYERIDALVVPAPGEAPLLRTLKRFAQLNGAYPRTQMVGWESLAEMLMTALRPVEAWRSLPEPMNCDLGQREALGDAIAAGLFFLHLHDSGATPAYFGDAVAVGDASATLMRWSRPDGSTRRVNAALESETLP